MQAQVKAHHGNNIRRFRSFLGLTQEAIAFDLDMTQQNFSVLEKKEEIENSLLEKIAKIMNIPVDLIKNFTEDGVINIISSTLHDNSGSVLYNPTFNPVDKVIELYERIIKEKNEKIELFQQIIKK